MQSLGVGLALLALGGVPGPSPSAFWVPHTTPCPVPTCRVAPWRTMLSRRRTPSPNVTPFPMETLGPSCGEDGPSYHESGDVGVLKATQQVYQGRETDRHLSSVPGDPHQSAEPLPEAGARSYHSRRGHFSSWMDVNIS